MLLNVIKTKHQQTEKEHREASCIAAKEKREKVKQQKRERERKQCEKKRTEAQEYNDSIDSPGFANQTSKKHSLPSVHSLPHPERRRKLFKALSKAHGQERFYVRVLC